MNLHCLYFFVVKRESPRPPRSEYNYRSAATASSLHPHKPYHCILFNGNGELDIAVGDEVALGGERR